mmetsp:Transcript_14601/g.27876  ORF Transcript_14601/g.27876 Transcript_14601/m.27876 type:complete len:86 (-) Transcript_14601:694-951(-)
MSLCCIRECALGSLASSPQASESSFILSHILAMAALKVLKEVVNQTVVKVLPTQMSIASCRFHLKDTIVNCEKRNIKRSATKIKN